MANILDGTTKFNPEKTFTPRFAPDGNYEQLPSTTESYGYDYDITQGYNQLSIDPNASQPVQYDGYETSGIPGVSVPGVQGVPGVPGVPGVQGVPSVAPEIPPESPYEMLYHASTYPLQYHLYAPPRTTFKVRKEKHERGVEDLFLPDKIREELQKKNEATLQILPGTGLPEFVSIYHSLVPLDLNIGSKDAFGHTSWAYKAISSVDGKPYCLRRIEGFKLTNEKALKTVQSWRSLNDPNVVELREAFTTMAFGDNSLVFVYDYYPLSQTLLKFLGSPGNTVSESEIWGYIVQLLTGLKAIHGRNLAARIPYLNGILVTRKGKVRINCVGILDVLNFPNTDLQAEQQQDITNVGHTLLVLTEGPDALWDIERAKKEVTAKYSGMGKLLDYVFSDDKKNVNELLALISDKVVDSLNYSLRYNDFLEDNLSRELENGRLVRLMTKLGFIDNRPEYNSQSEWSKAGERYPISLFRDFVFHQVDEYGRPVVDLVHVLTCLNKLDAGIDENILLVSRDEKTCVVTSYKELKANIQAAFRQLSIP